MSGRPLVGPVLVGVGACHTALTAVVARTGVRGIVAAGVLDGVRGHPADRTPGAQVSRGYAFWFATTGLGLVALGAVVTELERVERPLPPTVPLVLTGIGAWGAALLPRSPFWVLLAMAGVAERRRRQALRALVRPAG